MNRLNTKNVIEVVADGMTIEFTWPYIFYRSQGGEVIAIWFFRKQEFSAIETQWKRFDTHTHTHTHTHTRLSVMVTGC